MKCKVSSLFNDTEASNMDHISKSFFRSHLLSRLFEGTLHGRETYDDLEKMLLKRRLLLGRLLSGELLCD